MQTPQIVSIRVSQYPDANFRNIYHEKQGNISNGKFQRQSQNLTSQFRDSIFRYIDILNCHTARSKTFIDNNFYNNINESGNLATDISYHLAQFLINLTVAKIKLKPKKILNRQKLQKCYS